MNDQKDWKELVIQLKTFSKWTISGLIDSAFLVIWVFAQWCVNRTIATIALSSIDEGVFLAFQILFAISTLAPVVIYMYVDIRIMILRSQKKN